MLADSAINAQHIFVSLIEYRVERNGGLARLPVAQNQFALTTAYGNERVDGLDSGLQRHVTGGRSMIAGALRSMGSRSADMIAALPSSGRPRGSMTRPINSSPTTTSMTWPNALYFVASVKVEVIAEQDHADFVFIELNVMPCTFPGNLSTSSNPTPGRPDTFATPEAMLVTAPLSRNFNRGSQASRT